MKTAEEKWKEWFKVHRNFPSESMATLDAYKSALRKAIEGRRQMLRMAPGTNAIEIQALELVLDLMENVTPE